MLGYSLTEGAKIGYYQGNPAKLVSDCAALKPNIFASVPRLFNRIYGTIKGKFTAAEGCS
jgi:long-chain acyl-CoA synthetase